MSRQRPQICINMAMTADGKITSSAREYPRFTSSYDRRSMDRIRAECDAILVGAGTMRADDPPLHVRDAEMRERRRMLGKPEGLLRVLVSASLTIAPDSRFFAEEGHAGCVIATVERADDERSASLAERAEIWKLGEHRVDLEALVHRLRERGVERLLVEGGAETNWSFLERGLVDELFLTLAPALLGGREAPTIVGGAGWPMGKLRRLELLSVEREGDELYLHYRIGAR